MGSCQSKIPPTKVVIVGGGYVGTAAAAALDSKCEVVLVEPQDAIHHKIGALRAVVVPGWENRLRIPLSNALKNGEIVRDEVVSVSNSGVTLKNGTKINADFVILAHGGGPSNFPLQPLPGVTDTSVVVAAAKQKQDLIAKSDSILIIGGGPVGVELAGEIKAQHPGKKIVLVHSQSTLLSNSTPPIFPKATQKLAELLEERGIEVRFGVRVTDMPTITNGDAFVEGRRTYTLSDGSELTTDLTVVAIGAAPRDHNIIDVVNDRQQVMVDKFLRVKGYDNVFCVGDANDWPETKLTFTGELQANHVAKIIIALRSDKAITEYKGLEKGRYGVMGVPVGPGHGVTGFGETVLGNFLTSQLKGKDLFTSAKFKQTGAVVPIL